MDETMQPQSNDIGELASALAKAQGVLEAAKRTETNYFQRSYADLASCWEACREALAANGLAVTQAPWGEDLLTTLLHSSGQWIRSRLPLRPTKQDPQAQGSAITYARRYALCAIVGISPEDDDGEAAMGRGRRQSAGDKPPPPPDAPEPPIRAEADRLRDSILRMLSVMIGKPADGQTWTDAEKHQAAGLLGDITDAEFTSISAIPAGDVARVHARVEIASERWLQDQAAEASQ